MNIEKLNEFLLKIDYYYKDGEPTELCEIDNKIDELTELLSDAIREGLGKAESQYDMTGRINQW